MWLISGRKNRSKKADRENQQLNGDGPTATTLQQSCNSCGRLEQEVKRLKGDLSHLKQLENEMRQKVESNTNLKSNLLGKQKENEELEKK